MKQCDIWYWTDIKWLLTSHNSLAYFQWHWKYAKELWDDMKQCDIEQIMIWNNVIFDIEQISNDY